MIVQDIIFGMICRDLKSYSGHVVIEHDFGFIGLIEESIFKLRFWLKEDRLTYTSAWLKEGIDDLYLVDAIDEEDYVTLEFSDPNFFDKLNQLLKLVKNNG